MYIALGPHCSSVCEHWSESLKDSPVWPSLLLVSVCLSCLCLLSANLPSSVQFGSASVSAEQSMYPEFCVSHSREKSKEGAMAVFLLSASDIQVIHRQQCATLLPAFARGSLPLVCVPDFHADSLTFCSSEACSTHAGWFPYHFSVPTMNPDEVLVFCSPKASDYGI